MKILALGDTHASRTAIWSALETAADSGLDVVFQVGDFGYWPRSANGKEFLDVCQKAVRHFAVPLYWLPGNHEDWATYKLFSDKDRYTRDGFWELGDHFFGAPRVNSWYWEGVQFGSLGGAFSVDHRQRTAGWDWFEEEQPSYEDVDALPMDLDVLLTHEAPINLVATFGLDSPFLLREDDEERSFQSQDVIAQAIDKTTPSVVIHGHWHTQTVYQHGTATVCGLNRSDGFLTQDASVVIDTDRRIVQNWNQFLYGSDEGYGF